MTTCSDRELLVACRAGNRDAFGQFYVRHRALLLGYLVRRVGGDPEIAADLMAEAFASALLTTLDTDQTLPDAPAAWLFRVARNLMIDSTRRGRVEAIARRKLGLEPLALDDHDVERILDIAASHDVLADWSRSMPAAEWDALRAYVLEDETYPQIAARLRCSQALVRKRVSRAKNLLRTAIGDAHA